MYANHIYVNYATNERIKHDHNRGQWLKADKDFEWHVLPGKPDLTGYTLIG